MRSSPQAATAAVVLGYPEARFSPYGPPWACIVSGTLEPDALACDIWEERVGDAQDPCAALVLHLNKLAGFVGLVETLTECLKIHAFPHFPA